jgi:threonine dehydratase
VSNHVTDILTATEARDHRRDEDHLEALKIVMEPSCAVPLATILKNPDVFAASASA